MQYHTVPYYSAKTIPYRVDKPDFVFYTCSFSVCFKVTRISKTPNTHTPVNDSQIQFARCDNTKIESSEKKCKEVKSMYKFVSEIDEVYYTTLI